MRARQIIAFIVVAVVAAESSTSASSYPSSWDVFPSSMDAPASENIVDLGVASMDDLKETKLCSEGKICTYKSKIFNKMTLESDNGMTSGMGRSVGMPTRVIYTISSQCGSPSHEFYRLDIHRYRVSSVRGTTRFMREHPVFFNVRRGTAKIDRVFFSRKERKSIKGIKLSLLLQIARLIHPKAMLDAKQAPRGHTFRYVVPGHDDENGAKYRVLHSVRSLGNGNVVLSERAKYERPKVFFHGDKAKSLGVDAPTLAIHRVRRSDARILGSGRLNEVRETDQVDVGHHISAAETHPEKDTPVVVGPGLGHSRSTARTVTRLVSAKRNNEMTQCQRHAAAAASSSGENVAVEDAEMSVPESISQVLDRQVEVRDFRKPFTMEDWGSTDDETPEAVLRHVQRARRIMSQPNFDIVDLYDNIKPSTVGPIVNIARKRYLHGEMSVNDLSTVIGALAGVRETSGYKELLRFLEDKKIPSPAREDAAIALIHNNVEAPAPWYVIHRVAAIAHDPTDDISGSARLVLGNMLRGHAGEDETDQHVATLKSRLAAHRNELLRPDPKAQKKSNDGLEELDVEDILVANVEELAAKASSENSASSDDSSSNSNVDEEDDNDPVDVASARDAINLLHTLGNAGPAAAPLAGDEVADFAALGKDYSIRQAAREALKEMNEEVSDVEESDNNKDNEEVISDLEKNPFNPGIKTKAPNEELSAVKRKGLIDFDKQIYGNKNVEIRAVSRLGIKYGGHAIGSFGMGSLHGRVLDFKKDLATFEYNAGTRRKKDISGAEGVMEFTFKIVGATVQKFNKPYSMGNVEHGGSCPSTWFDTLEIKKPTKKSWTRTLIIFPVRCGPAKVTTSIVGTIGYVLGWSGYHNCVSSQGLEFVNGEPPPFPKEANKDGEASSSSTMMGGNIKGKLDVVIKNAVEFGSGRPVGWQGKFMLYYGQMPSYCILDQQQGVCHTDIDLQPMEGKLTLIGACFGPSRKRVMIEWKVPKQYRTMKERAYGPLVSGNLEGHPNCALQEALELGMTYYDPTANSDNKDDFPESLNPPVASP